MIKLKLILLLSVVLVMQSCKKDDDEPTSEPAMGATTKYQLTFNATWSASTHPTDFPVNPHFSGLIGLTHTADTSLFYMGSPASLGIKDMAERGKKEDLMVNIQQIIAAGKGQMEISGEGIGTSPNTVMVEFEINSTHPVVTVTSMIAPSPDWFVAAHNITLYQNHNWEEELTVNVGVYDAGTDGGTTFASDDSPTNPFDQITAITTPPLAVNGVVQSLGTMVFKKIE